MEFKDMYYPKDYMTVTELNDGSWEFVVTEKETDDKYAIVTLSEDNARRLVSLLTARP